MGQIKNIKLHIVTDIKVNMTRNRIKYFLASIPASVGEDTLKQHYGHIVDEYRFVGGEYLNVKDENEVASTSASTSSKDVQNIPDFLVKNEEDENVDVVDVVECISVEGDTTNTNTSGHSSGLATVQVQQPTNGKWTCGECGKVYNSRQALHRHKKTHLNIRPFSCVQCDKTFVYKHTLVDHEKIHTGVKEHVCGTCGREFLHKFDLTVHIKTHTGTKEHICLTCNKMFLLKSHLTRHEKTHTGTKEHICLTCNKMFLDKYNLTQHEKIHSGIKDFVCGICNEAFRWKYQLIKHQKTRAGNSGHELN